MSDNLLTSLDTSSFQGTNLTRLYLSANKFTTIDENVFQGLSNLSDLHLSENQISYIKPNNFKGLSDLLNLGLNQNQLNTIPLDTFNSLSKLQKLELQNNQLTSDKINNIFNGLKNLTWSSLASNKITVIDATLNLQVLHLNDNQISTLDSNKFESLINLQEFYVYNIKLKKMDAFTFKELSNLKILNLEFNKIVSFNRNALVGLNKLEKVCIFENPFYLASTSLVSGLCMTNLK